MEPNATPVRAEFSSQPGFGRLIGDSLPMRHLRELIGRCSESTARVLVLGETGTGKELVARCIHSNGIRGRKPFITVDCSALSPSLVESELFGHVRGAFTDASSSRRGLLQAAEEGTVFLDEIGELPLPLQVKLLRALQEKEVRPVGSTGTVRFAARVIAATNRDLEAEARTGTFRQDLFFRLNVLQIRVPPLRDRRADIPLLVAHFLEKLSIPPKRIYAISNGALKCLMNYDWPGNIRELQNAIERAVALSSNTILTEDDLPPLSNGTLCVGFPTRIELGPLAELERRATERAMRETGGNATASARLLGIGASTLYRKLKEYECSRRRM